MKRYAARSSRMFWAKVEKTDGCWLWTGYTKRGYGIFGKPPRGAYCYTYEQEHGPVPAGLEIDHLCNVRLCVRPDHLEAVTHAENNRRIHVRRGQCKWGHPYTPENMRIVQNGTKYGTRACRPCERRRSAEYKLRKRAEATP